MVFRYATALLFVAFAFGLFVNNFAAAKTENLKAGPVTRLSSSPQTGKLVELSYSTAFTTATAVQATPTPAPSPTPVPPTPTPPATQSGSGGNSPIFLIFLVIIFGGFILALAFATIRSRLRR